MVLNNGEFYTTNFDTANHYEDNILYIEKFDSEKPWTAVVYDADNQGYPYLKTLLYGKVCTSSERGRRQS